MEDDLCDKYNAHEFFSSNKETRWNQILYSDKVILNTEKNLNLIYCTLLNTDVLS